MTDANTSTDPQDVAKVREIMESIDIAMVTTIDAHDPDKRLVSRPLSTQVAEADGDVLFLVRRDSSLALDITADPRINVAYTSKKAWVSLAGTGSVIDDRALVAELWSTGASMFMDGGPENPDNVVVKVDGDTAELWGGDSLVGTAVRTAKQVIGKGDDESGSTTVELP